MKARLLDPSFEYINAAQTNVQNTWRKFGWKPKHEMSGVRSLDRSEPNQNERQPRPKIARVR